MVPVNYGMRFSGPVTALTARRVRYGIGHLPVLEKSGRPQLSPGVRERSLIHIMATTRRQVTVGDSNLGRNKE